MGAGRGRSIHIHRPSLLFTAEPSAARPRPPARPATSRRTVTLQPPYPRKTLAIDRAFDERVCTCTGMSHGDLFTSRPQSPCPALLLTRRPGRRPYTYGPGFSWGKTTGLRLHVHSLQPPSRARATDRSRRCSNPRARPETYVSRPVEVRCAMRVWLVGIREQAAGGSIMIGNTQLSTATRPEDHANPHRAIPKPGQPHGFPIQQLGLVC
jgi:hypothetical protein